MARASDFRRLRAPQVDGQTLVDPPLEVLPEVVAQNRQHLHQADYDVQGQALRTLSFAARRALVTEAITYTRQYRDIPSRLQNPPKHVPFVLSGHQPDLFHPGVWYKNFVLGALARELGGVGIHLLIDSDMCRSVSIRVPSGTATEPHVAAIPYDIPSPEMPHEERVIRDPATFSRFAERAASLIRPLVPDPMVSELWPLMLERNKAQKTLGLRLAQGRHALEETWHNATLELPQSSVCALPEFHWFVAHLLAHLPRFWNAHNDALAAYRLAHRMRSRAHPVPDLAERDGWLEAPFWIWTADEPERRPLYAWQNGDQILISDLRQRSHALSLSADRDASVAAEQLLALSKEGIKIRTRAITTTLFARLVLSDLFLHGIGGAKYDQVTDEIVRLFFGFEAPKFATVSATLRLPIMGQRGANSTSDRQGQLRQLRYHPEQFIERNGAANSSDVEEIIASKLRWVQTPKTPDNARQRHLAIVAANEALQPFLASVREQILHEQEELRRRQRADAILRSREFSFALYPRSTFERLVSDLVLGV